MLKKQLEETWMALKAKQPYYKDYLDEISISGLRGLDKLTIRFPYSVSVIAGANAAGKSTILFAAGCAYRVPGAGVKDHVPSTFFPRFTPQNQLNAQDQKPNCVIRYGYRYSGERFDMEWRAAPNWSRSFLGRKQPGKKTAERQPSRQVYLRRLRDLSNPAELQNAQQSARTNMEKEDVPARLLTIAQRLLRTEYLQLSILKSGKRDYLFAQKRRGTENGVAYSEFHMSAGERAVLRLTMDIAELTDALVLIDEIDTGLHPGLQQQLMLELQRLAVRNNLQIIVTTHSVAVLDCVPPEGRIFIERSEDGAFVRPPYRDIIERALYGDSIRKFSVLCEDDVAEGVTRGIFDHIAAKLNLRHSDLVIERDTGKDEFIGHIRTLGRAKVLDGFIFILDGDARNLAANLTAELMKFGVGQEPLFLPGVDAPEKWIWEKLKARVAAYEPQLGLAGGALGDMLTNLESVYEGALGKPGDIPKERFIALTDKLARTPSELARIVGKTESERKDDASLVDLIDSLERAVRRWQE